MHISIILYFFYFYLYTLHSKPWTWAISSALHYQDPGGSRTLQSSMTVSLIIKATLPDSSPTGGRLLSSSLLAPMANFDPSGEKVRQEIEVGNLGYCFIRFFVKWSQRDTRPSEPPDANVLWLPVSTMTRRQNRSGLGKHGRKLTLGDRLKR